MASRAPLAGYNHNVRYRNRIYHVQSEDSGVDAPHIFTHVFLDGMIISSARTDYDDLVEQEGHEPQVRKLMQKQHKELMKQLRRGEFDDKIIAIKGALEPEIKEGAGAGAGTAAAAAAAAVIDTDESPEAEEPAVAAGAAEPAPAPAEPAPAPAEPAGAPAGSAPAGPAPPPAEPAPAPAPASSRPAPLDREPMPAALHSPLPPVPQPDDMVAAGDLDAAVADTLAGDDMTAPDSALPLFPEETDPALAPDEAPAPAARASAEPVTEPGDAPPPPEPLPGSAPPEDIEITQFLDVDQLRQATGQRPAVSEPPREPAPGRPPPAAGADTIPMQAQDLGPQPIPHPERRAPADTGTSYSHVYRDRVGTPTDRLGRGAQPGAQGRPRERGTGSNVFRSPLPAGSRLPTPDDALPDLDPSGQPRSGVYLVPGGPPQRPPHPDPAVRTRQPSGQAPRHSSSPQQYTAPSRPAGQAPAGGKRRTTGAYEAVPSTRQSGVSRPAARPQAPRPGAGGAPGQPRSGSWPGARPEPRRQPGGGTGGYSVPQRPPTPARPSGPVVARPAVIVGEQPGGRPSGPARGRPTPPPASKVDPRQTRTPTGPIRLDSLPREPAEPAGPPQADEPPRIFGSDLISERSLDEVILAYLAEDSEGGEE